MSSSEDDIVRQVTAKLTGEFYIGQKLRIYNPSGSWTAIVRGVGDYTLLLEEELTTRRKFYDMHVIRALVDNDYVFE